MLYINHSDVYVKSLDLDGALVVEGQQGSTVTIDGLQVHNKGWEWQPLKESSSTAEHERIRCVTPKLLHKTDMVHDHHVFFLYKVQCSITYACTCW